MHDRWNPPHPAGLIALLLAMLAFASGCSTFDRDWNRAATVPESGFAGRWTGTWHSDANGHNDALRCVITPATGDVYPARFHAKYHKGIFHFTFGYTVPLTVTNTGGIFEFAGVSNLGWYAGGIYRYRGTANATNFFATYDSKYDRGTFEMHRP